MEEEREEGITLRELAALVGKRIWWLLALAALVALAAGLLTAFVFNRGKDSYSVSFVLVSAGDGQSYPDGTPLRMETLVHAQNLQRVKESDAAFADIDVAAMSSEEGITLTERRVQESGEGTGVYVICAGSAWFQNKEQGARFLRAVAQRAAEDIHEQAAAMRFRAWEKQYEGANSYAERIGSVRTQYDALLARYDGYLADDAYAWFCVEGETLAALRGGLEAALGERITQLEREYANEKFILSDAELAQVLSTVRALEIEREGNERKIAALEQQLEDLYAIYGTGMSSGQLDTFESFHETIRDLTARNAAIGYETERLYTAAGYTLSEGVWTAGEGYVRDAAFEAELVSVRTELAAQTSACERAIAALWTQNSYVSFEQSGVLVVRGGTSVALVAAAGFVVALLAGMVAVCAVRYPAYKRRMTAAPPARQQEGGTE